MRCGVLAIHSPRRTNNGSSNGDHFIRGLARRGHGPRHTAAGALDAVEGNRHLRAPCCLPDRGSSSALVLSGGTLRVPFGGAPCCFLEKALVDHHEL
jgi:hypothetical protein